MNASPNKGEILISENIGEIIKNLSRERQEELGKLFLRKTYASFFVFEKLTSQGEINLSKFIKFLIKSRGFENFEDAIVDLSDILSKEYANVENAYIFPFIKVKYNPYNKNLGSQFNEVFDLYEAVFFRNIFVVKIRNKVIVFTDLNEDFFDNSIEKLKENGYQKIEIHSILPKIIDSLAEKFKSGDAEIKELGISFPLSLLGPHAKIQQSSKSANASSDMNFRNLIRYGLLDSVKISSSFNISFNIKNDKDKYVLPGYIYGDTGINLKLFEALEAFLNEVDKVATTLNNDFAGLPIYSIIGRKSYETPINYPTFFYNALPDGSIDLILSFSNTEALLDGEKDSNISGNYLITGIFPQYLKVRRKEGQDRFCYLKLKDEPENEDWKINTDILKNLIGVERHHTNCEGFLSEIAKELSNNYIYQPYEYEEVVDEEFEGHGHSNFMPSDIYLTALKYGELESNNQSEFLINIVIPKRGTEVKKVSVDLYRLSSFSFKASHIEKLISWYINDGRGVYSLGTIKKIMLPNYKLESTGIEDYGHFSIDGREDIKIFKKIPYTKSGNFYGKQRKSVNGKYACPSQYESLELGDSISMEDLWSLSCCELLNINKHTAFFGGRTRGGASRELADIISTREVEKRIREGKNIPPYLDINLFHMKLSPFEQKGESKAETGFSLYTTVLGQILEKIKSFLYVSSTEEILEGLKDYFLKDGDYKEKIYEHLTTVIKKNSKQNINFNVFFPIREKDYFLSNLEKLSKNERLALETNWKRLKILNEIFEANIGNIGVTRNIRVNIGLIICKPSNIEMLPGNVSTDIYIINNLSSLFRKI